MTFQIQDIAQGGASGSFGAGVTSAQVTITTVNADELIVLLVASGGTFHDQVLASVADNQGLTWTKWFQYDDTAVNNFDVEVWWAHAATPATHIITATTPAGGTGALNLVAVAVEDADVADPFDAHPTNPDNERNSGSGNPTASINTAAYQTLLLAMYQSKDVATGGGISSPFTYEGEWTQTETGGWGIRVALGSYIETAKAVGRSAQFTGGTTSDKNVLLLAIREAGAITPAASPASYSETWSTGNRTASITIASSGITVSGTVNNLVDGAFGNNTTDSIFWSAFTGNGTQRLEFTFPAPVTIDEVKWYQRDAFSQGVVKWQYFNGITWQDATATFTLGGATTQTQTALNGNGFFSNRWRMLFMSGSFLGTTYDQEIEFKYTLDDASASFELEAALVDESVLTAALSVVMNYNLSAALVDESVLTVELESVENVNLSAAMVDESVLTAVLQSASSAEMEVHLVDDSRLRANIEVKQRVVVQTVVIVTGR